MKKSICIEKIFLELDFYERFQAVADAGFHYVEFWSWENKDLPRVKELCERYHLQVASISGDKDYSLILDEEREKYLYYFKRSLEVARTLSCHVLVLHSNAINEYGKISNAAVGISHSKKVASMVKTLLTAVQYAEQYGIRLVLEALNTVTQPGCFLVSTEDSGDIARVVNSDCLKILYDVWHMEHMEENISSTLKKYRDVLGYVHIADSNGRHEPGTGTIDFVEVNDTLLDIGYSGFLGFELTPSGSSADACKVIASFCR